MDVHAIHQGFLRGMRRAGGAVVCDAEVTSLRTRRRHLAGAGRRRNATKRRWWSTPPAPGPTPSARSPALARSACNRAAAPPSSSRRPQTWPCARWPMTVGVDEDWYIKPDAGMLLGSPANADPVEPHDVQPEEMDIALAIDRIERMTTLTIRRPTRTWAGLRSFVADGDLVGGFDADAARLLLGRGAGRLRHPDLAGHGRSLRRARARRCPCRSTSPASASRRRCSRRRGCAASSSGPGQPPRPPDPTGPSPCASSAAALATETNTFAPMPTGMRDVPRPRLLPGRHASGPHVLFRRAAVGGAAARQGAGLGRWSRAWSPARSRAARPRAPCYEALRDELLADLRAALPVDMVLLGLHGAMVADGYDDCEGDLLQRVRAIVGRERRGRRRARPAQPPHAGDGRQRRPAGRVQGISAHRRARARAASWSTCARRKVEKPRPPGGGGGRLRDDRHDAHLARAGPRVRRPHPGAGRQGRRALDLHRATASPGATCPRWAPRCWSTPTATWPRRKPRAPARRRADRPCATRWRVRYPGIDAALDEALAFEGGPVVLADGADNPGGGAASDSTFILRRMVERGIAQCRASARSGTRSRRASRSTPASARD